MAGDNRSGEREKGEASSNFDGDRWTDPPPTPPPTGDEESDEERSW